MACLKGIMCHLSELGRLLQDELGQSAPWRSHERVASDAEFGSKRKNGESFEANQLPIYSLAFCTFLSTLLYGWLELTSSADVYYLVSFLEAVFTLALLYVVPLGVKSQLKSTLFSLMSQKRFAFLAILQSIVIVWMGSYSKNSFANANRSDAYELFLVSAIPSVIISTQVINKFHTKVTESAIFIITGIKLLILCRDPIFMPGTSASIACFLVSIAQGLVLTLLYCHLQKEHLFLILQFLMACKIPVTILLTILNGEDIQEFLSIRNVIVSFVLAVISITRMISTLLLLKHTNPLFCIITTNLSWIPMTLVRAFIFKFLFLISSFKLLVFFLFDFFVIIFRCRLDKLVES